MKKCSSSPFAKRLGCYFDYYKWTIVLAMLLAFLTYVIGNAVVQGGKEIVLQGFFTNDVYNAFDAGELAQSYEEERALPQKARVVFDDSLYIDLHGAATEYTAASRSKLLAYMATGELDFVVTSHEVFDNYKQSIALYDLRTLLTAEALDGLESALLYDEAGVAVGLDLADCRLVGAEVPPAAYCLFVPLNAPHPQEVISFVAFCYSFEGTCRL